MDGTGLVTAQVNPDGNLYAWEQPPGATKWVKKEVAAESPTGAALGARRSPPACPAVQIVSEDAAGISSSQPLGYGPALAYTGSNLVLTALQQQAPTKQRLDFWWQGSTFTTFNFETVATAIGPKAFGPRAPTATSGEVAITAPTPPTTSP